MRRSVPPSIAFGDISLTIFHDEGAAQVSVSVEDLSRAPGDMIRGRRSFDWTVTPAEQVSAWVLDVVDPY